MVVTVDSDDSDRAQRKSYTLAGRTRSNFAEALANALVLGDGAPSIVAAIEGEWGTGKTSLLNLVEYKLSSHDDQPLIVRLESWLLAGSESILQTFLIQLAARLGREDNSERTLEAANRVLKLSHLLTPARLIPGVGSIAAVIQEVTKAVGEGAKSYAELSTLDIQKRKDDVSIAIKNAHRPICVIIDDLDRLDPEETRHIFRLVKAVADFERVSYLLSYDPEPVHKALSFDGTYDGTKYLEKIVQISYPLPAPSYWALKRFLRSKLEKLIEGYAIEEYEIVRIRELLSQLGGLAHAVRHPRDVNRLMNRLAVSLPPTRGEVNLADVIAFEMISVRFPKVARVIRRRPYDFTGGWSLHDEPLVSDLIKSLSTENASELPDWKLELWCELGHEDQRPLKSLLEFLFPGFTKASTEYAPAEILERELRICRLNTLLKLLSVGLFEGSFSANDSRAFLRCSDQRIDIMNRQYSGEMPTADSTTPGFRRAATSSGWLEYTTQFLEEVDIDDPRDLLFSLVDKAKELTTLDRIGSHILIREMAVFTTSVLKKLRDSEAVPLLHGLARSDQCVSLTHWVVLAIAKEHGLWKSSTRENIYGDKIIIDKKAVEEAIEEWLETVRRLSRSTKDFLGEPDCMGILFRWGQFGDFSEVQDWVESLTASPEGVTAFVESWLPRHHPSGFDDLFKDWRRFKRRCEEHPNHTIFLPGLWEHFIELEERAQSMEEENQEGKSS